MRKTRAPGDVMKSSVRISSAVAVAADSRTPKFSSSRLLDLDIQSPLDVMETLLFNSLVASGLKRAFGLETNIAFDVMKDRFLLKNGDPLGVQFIRAIEKRPELAKAMVSDAKERYASSLVVLEALGAMAEDTAVPMRAVVEKWAEFFSKTHEAALDYVFDHTEYRDTIIRHLREPVTTRHGDDIIRSISPSNGICSRLSFEKNALLHLAGKSVEKTTTKPSAFSLFNRFSESPDSWPGYFAPYDNWYKYRKNYVPSRVRLSVLDITEETQVREIGQLVSSRRIDTGEFYSVYEALRDLQRNEMTRREEYRKASENLVHSAATDDSRGVISALTYFAGEACSMNETMHKTNTKSAALLLLAAEKRGLDMQALMGIVGSVLTNQG